MTLAQSIQLEIDGAPSDLRVARLTGVERIHAPFRFELACAPMRDGGAMAEIVAEDVLAKPAKITWVLGDGAERVIEGYVEAITTTSAAHTVVVAPKLAWLEDAVDHVVFVDEDAVAIAKKVLSEHGVTADVRVTRSLPKRKQCVQLFETDLGFVRRILAEEGVALYLPLDKKDAVVFADHPSGFEDVPGLASLSVREHGGVEAAESVTGARLRRTMVSDKATLRDYLFENPKLDLTAEAATGDGARERYEFPGGYEDKQVGGELAQIRLEERTARKLVLTARTSSRALSPGYVVTLEGAAVERVNGRWLVVEVAHELADLGTGGAGDKRYEARFTAVPADEPHRPARTPAPRVAGVQTATVTAPGGVEIHTEKYGRSKVHLRWDRRRPMDDTSSAWARVLQPPTSGSLYQPRTGWEVVTGFRGPSADQPFLWGRVYNGTAVPPKSLPGTKTSTMFGSMTTPGGGSANVVLMDDTAGNEGMSFVASKNWNERTENDKASDVTADDTWSVGANRKLIVGEVHQVTVTGAQTYTVGGSRTVNLEANFLTSAASESVMVGGLRLFNIGGDYLMSCASLTRLVGAAKIETAIEHQNRLVTGMSTILVGGSWSETGVVSASVKVGGVNTEAVAGAKTIKAGKYELTVRGALSETVASRKVKAGAKITEEYKGPLAMNVGGSMKIKGADVSFKATGKITLKASGITVTMTPGEITIDGKFAGKVKSVDEGNSTYE